MRRGSSLALAVVFAGGCAREPLPSRLPGDPDDAPDLAVSVDLPALPDLAVPKDLKALPDLAVPPDLRTGGTHRWSRGFGDHALAYDIEATADGGAVIVGQFTQTVDFGGGPLTSAGGADIF